MSRTGNAAMLHKFAVVALAACAASFAGMASARTMTMMVNRSADGIPESFDFAFSNVGSGLTNALYLACGYADGGTESFAGWNGVRQIALVPGDATALVGVPAPDDLGAGAYYMRFFLTSGNADIPGAEMLDSIKANSNVSNAQYVMTDFTPSDKSAVEIDFSFHSSGNNQCFFSARGTDTDHTSFSLFWLPSDWRWDYDVPGTRRPGGSPGGTRHVIRADANGLLLDGAIVSGTTPAAATFTAGGPMSILCSHAGGTINNGQKCKVNLYSFKAWRDGSNASSLVLDLVPCRKQDGTVCLYNRVDGNFLENDGEGVFKGGNVVSTSSFSVEATSDLVTAIEGFPTVFSPAASMTVSDSITNAVGGILNGPATLTLTGENDWGGSFIVSNGTLVAEFGQGLAATDCLRLETDHASSGSYGGYGGWNGRATASLGSGAGQICVTAGNYLAYCAADGGELEVDIGGAGAPWTPTAADRRLILNGMPEAGTLRFKNPIVLDSQDLIVRVGYGTAIFEENVASVNSGAGAKTIECYGLDGASDGVGIFSGTENHFLNFNVNKNGSYVFGPGSTNTIDGNLKTASAEVSSLVITNSLVELTGGNGGGAWLNVFGGKVELCGDGELRAGGVYVGETNDQANVEAKRPSLVLRGKVVLEAKGSDALTQSFGSLNVCKSSRSDALVIEDGADVSMRNLVLNQRNVRHRGGRVVLTGGNGLCNIGNTGRARYWLYSGAELVAPCVKCNIENAPAHFIFIGGKVTTRQPGSYFLAFGGSASGIMVASRYGGEFCATNAVSIQDGIVEVLGDIGAPEGASDWDYAKSEWLTASAFRKTGGSTLTMIGTNTYNCATDVAEGTLKLGGGEKPGVLPTNGVVRVTGGTLDLGGNEQTVRALLGTAGAVMNGTLIAKEGIYPGGSGAVGSFTCGAALDGELHVDVDVSTGASDKIVANGTLDLSRIDLVLSGADIGAVQKFRVVEGATTGEFHSVSGLPNGWEIKYKADGLWVGKVVGMAIICR